MSHFSIKDYFSMFRLSLRSWIWKPRGIRNQRNTGCLVIVKWIFIIDCFNHLLSLPYYLWQIATNLNQYFNFPNLSALVIKTIVCFIVVFNPYRFYYAMTYKKRIWYQNTGIKPSEVISDVGIYGEYIATICTDMNLKHNNVKGYVFNNVFVPKKDGDFNEIDIISVSEMGIHVIEAKARFGIFRGNMIDQRIIKGSDPL